MGLRYGYGNAKQLDFFIEGSVKGLKNTENLLKYNVFNFP